MNTGPLKLIHQSFMQTGTAAFCLGDNYVQLVYAKGIKIYGLLVVKYFHDALMIRQYKNVLLFYNLHQDAVFVSLFYKQIFWQHAHLH